jgi:hypothetical protein
MDKRYLIIFMVTRMQRDNENKIDKHKNRTVLFIFLIVRTQHAGLPAHGLHLNHESFVAITKS